MSAVKQKRKGETYMDKKTFLLKLRQELSVLQEEELQDIISEYEQHIDMKVENGLTEEEAIADFGSMTELTAEILEAYHVRADYTGGSSGRRGKDFSKVPDDITDDKKSVELDVRWKEAIKKLWNAASDGISAAGAAVKHGVLWGKRQISRPFLWILRIWRNRKRAGERENQENLFRQNRKKKGNMRRHFMERKEYDENQQGILAAIGCGISRICRGCLNIALWCIRMAWNICCIGASLMAGFFGLFCLYGLGVSLVLLLQGYPLSGVSMGCLGLVLCMFSLAGFGFTLRWVPKGQRAVKKDPEPEKPISWTEQEERKEIVVSDGDTEGEQHA